MQEVLLELHKVLDLGKVRLNNLELRQKEIDRKEVLLNDGLFELKEKQKSLADREQNIVPIENLHAFKAEAQGIMDTAISTRNELINEKKAFDDYKLGETNRLNELRITTQRDSDNLEAKRKYIDSEVNRQVNEFITKFKEAGK